MSSSLTDFLSKLAQVPSAEDVKNPFDYWSFIEAVFSPALRASLIPESGSLPPVQAVVEARDTNTSTFSHYTWSWAVEDCLNLSMLTAEEQEMVRSSLPRMDDRTSQVNAELTNTLSLLDKATMEGSVSFSKLHKWLKSSEKSDFSKLRNSCLHSLLAFAETLLVQLQKEQCLDSIEELHMVTSSHETGIVIDDGDRVRCYVTSQEDATALLNERDEVLEGPQAESVQYKYPFSCNSKLPQLGPFCHICRQSKPNMARCSVKLSQFYGEGKEFKSVCHRRFCQECLIAYNWAKPEGATPYKCPICLKLCTCDRCVRNVFLRSIRTFIAGLKNTTATNVEAPVLSSEARYVSSVHEFFTLIGEFSAFSVIPATPSLESPCAESGAPARVKRSIESRKRSPPNSVVKEPDPTKMKTEEVASDAEQDNCETPPSERRRRKAASVASSLLRTQNR
jgi:hypothetical protein